MTYKFSKTSIDKLNTCHKDLQTLAYELIKHRDITIICGFRSKKEQDAAVAAGNSKTKWPKSKHNSYPSMAFDIAEYPVQWDDIKQWQEFCKFVKDTANSLGIEIVSGGDWKSLKDYPHFELK